MTQVLMTDSRGIYGDAPSSWGLPPPPTQYNHINPLIHLLAYIHTCQPIGKVELSVQYS